MTNSLPIYEAKGMKIQTIVISKAKSEEAKTNLMLFKLHDQGSKLLTFRLFFKAVDFTAKKPEKMCSFVK